MEFILHSLAVPNIYSYGIITGRFDKIAKLIIDNIKTGKFKESDIKYVVPTGKEHIPELRLERKISKFVLCINDGETVRFKRGGLQPLLKWAVDEFNSGNISQKHSCFLSPIYKKV